MTMRARSYVVLAIAVVSAFAYTRMTRDWSEVAFYAGGAGVIALLVIAGNLWIELAPDGSLRRRSDDRAATD
jgi:hypothetical protein